MDLDRLKALIDLVSTSRITELELHAGDSRVRILRARDGSATAVPPAGTAAPAATPAATPPAGATASGAALRPVPTVTASAAATAEAGGLVLAPIFGVFHLTPSPGAAPFVEVGQAVEAGQKLGVIEAMKVFNAVQAETGGRVAEILAGAGEEVEPGQPLFRLA